MVENLVIIDSEPAGYTAFYAGRAQLKPVVFEGFEAGGVPDQGQGGMEVSVSRSPILRAIRWISC